MNNWITLAALAAFVAWRVRMHGHTRYYISPEMEPAVYYDDERSLM